MNNSSKIRLTNENGAEKVYGQIPDLWHLAMAIADGRDYGTMSKEACENLSEQILDVWHMAHDLKACAEKQQGNQGKVAKITEVRGVSHGRLSQLDAICATNTGFHSFFELVDAQGSYRPTIPVDETWGEILAIAYDTFQERAGDPRRSFRTGGKK
jgi:hypothetical protein